MYDHTTVRLYDCYDHPTVQPYNHTTIQGATFNICGQVYCRHINTTALFGSPVVSALGSKSDDPGSSPGQGKVLCPWDVQKKKIPAPLLGLAKSIYYIKYGKSGVECCFFCFSTSAYILETCGIEIVLTITEVEVEPSSPCKVSLSKSGAFSLSGKSSFSHGTLIGLLVVPIATVRRYFLQKLLF